MENGGPEEEESGASCEPKGPESGDN